MTFVLATEEYGFEILKVREIIGLMDITRVPSMPSYVVGVINLRGKVIPVVDLRLKFSMDSTEHTSETCIIVVDVHGQLMGVVVDKVSEVLDIRADDIEDAPGVGAAVDGGPLWCRPCYRKWCFNGLRCLERVSVEAVAARVREVVGG